MKRGLKSLLVLVVFGLIFVSLVGIVNAACPSDMVSYWTLDNADLSGNNPLDVFDENHGTTYGATIGQTGQVGEAFEFDGNEYVDIAGGMQFAANDQITIAAWIFTDPLTHEEIFGGCNDPNSHCEGEDYDALALRIMGEGYDYGDPNKLLFAIHYSRSYGSFSYCYYLSNDDIPFDQWVHVAAVYDPNNNDAGTKLYINGESVSRSRTCGNSQPRTITISPSIGAHASTNNGIPRAHGNYFDGMIDEVAIFNRTLSTAEISELHEKGLDGKDYCYSECSLGETSCSGANYLTCDNGWSWTDNGKVVGFCENLCQPDDIIMKLYSSSNSYGALWNYSGEYDWHICYSEIFETAYTGDLATVHDCTGSNKVLGLYAASNAHAEIPSLDDYTTDVCYGYLVCEAKTDPDPCSTDYEVVVRLYQDTNSYISNASDTSYPVKICCKPGAPTEDIYWANMLDTQISSADLGDTVKLIANIPGEEGKDITFEIWDINEFLGIDWLWPDSKVDSTTGVGFTKWITDTEDTFYFKVDVDRDGTFDYSSKGAPFGELTVSGPEDNSPPTATIINPSMSLLRANRRFKVGTAINFEKTIEDEDDDLEVTWDFGDGNTKTCINSEEDCDTAYSYSILGTKVVKLSAKEIGRWQEDVDYTRVFIYDEGINVFALITKPLFGKVFGAGARVVGFNADESYVADCTTGSCSPPHGEICYNVDDLECYDLSKDYISTDYELWFDWSFSDGSIRYGNWTNNKNEVVEFEKGFFTPTKHWANLKVGYEPK